MGVPITIWEEPTLRGVAAAARYAYLAFSTEGDHWGVTPNLSDWLGSFVTFDGRMIVEPQQVADSVLLLIDGHAIAYTVPASTAYLLAFEPGSTAPVFTRADTARYVSY